MWEKVRKFGLEYCDLPTMIWNVAFMLRALTLNIDSQYKKGIPKIFYIITPAIVMSYFYVYLVSMIWFVFWRCRETGKLVDAFIVFSLGITSEIGTAKFLFMYAYQKSIKIMVDEYRACDALVLPNSRMWRNLMKYMRIIKKRAMILWIVIISNGIVYIIRPFLRPGRQLLDETQILLGLEPMIESPNYEIGFLLTCGGVIFTVYLPANISALLIVLSGYTEAQMLALSKDLLHMWDDAQKHYKSFHNEPMDEAGCSFIATGDHETEIINEYIKERLESIVKIHAININLVGQLENIFRGSVAAEFMILCIGLIAQLLGGLENTYIEMPFAFIQVAMDCLTGQKLMDASLIFENALYDCKWENFDVTNRKTVLLMLQNSQKTLTLSAGGIATLNFVSLMGVIKTVYSAYTTLRSTMN